MAEYKGIKGFKVQTVSTDPAASIIATGTWASGGSLNTARIGLGGAGTKSTALVFFGNSNPAPANVGNTELYNGTSWTELADGNSIRAYLAGFGTPTAAIGTGGYGPGGDSGLTESWNGTSWTEVGDLNTGRPNIQNANAGVSTAGLVWGGYNPPNTPSNRAITESWNGTSWTEVNDLNTGRYDTGGNGTQTDAITVFGTTGDASAETWNGTSWTAAASGNTARTGNALTGNSTLALTFSGATPSYVGLTEYYDGSSWTELADLTTGRNMGVSSQAGTTSETLLAGGRASSTRLAVTEEWTVAPPASFQKENLGQVFYNSTSNAFKVTKDNSGAPLGTWSSGGPLNSARIRGGGSGIQTAALYAGGDQPVPFTNVENYNGTSWTEVNDINTARGRVGSFGVQTSALIAGGSAYPGSPVTNTELYNGTSWTEVNDIVTTRNGMGGAGVTTAGLIFGGDNPALSPARVANTEEYNGTSWSEVNDLNTARWLPGAAGNQTAAIAIAGDNSGFFGGVELYNGTSWTETTDINSTRIYGGGFGTQTDCYYAGGYTPPVTPSALTEYWNGTTWTEVADLGAARAYLVSAQNASSSAGLLSGGNPPPTSSTASEEWNAPAPFTTNNTLTAR